MKKFLTIFTAMIMAVNTFAQQIDKNTVMANYSFDANERLIGRVLDTLYAMDCYECLFPASKQRQVIATIANDYGYTEITSRNIRDFSDRMIIISGDKITGTLLIYTPNPDGIGYSVGKYERNVNDKFIAFADDGRPFIKIEGRPLTPTAKIVRSNMAPAPVPTTPLVEAIKAPVTDANIPVIPTPTVTAQQKAMTGVPVGTTNNVNNGTINVISASTNPSGNYGTYGLQEVVAIGQTIRGAETGYVAQPRTYGGNGYPGGGYGYCDPRYGGAVVISGSVSIGSGYNYGYYGYPYYYNSSCVNTGCNQPVTTYGTNCGAVTGSSGGVYPHR